MSWLVLVSVVTLTSHQVFASAEMDAQSDHAGHDSESLMEMHSAEAVLAIASSDSNSTPADVPLRALLVLARLLSFPPEHRPEALFELVALMAAVVNTIPVRPSGPMIVGG